MSGVQDLAETLAAQLRRSVAIDDLDGRLLAHTAHQEPVDRYRIDSIMRRSGRTVTAAARRFGIADATAPVRVPADPELGSLARVCAPIRCQRTLLGYLWLFDQPEPLTDAQLDLVATAANTAGETLFREQLLDDLRRGTERELLRDLVNPLDEVRRHAIARLTTDHGIDPAAQVQAVVVALEATVSTVSTIDVDLALRHAARRLSPTRTLGMATSATTGLLLLVDPALPSRTRLHTEAERVREDFTVSARLGIGSPRDSLAHSVDSYRAAQEAVRVAGLVPSLGPITFADELGVYGLLARLALDTLETDPLPPGLRKLVETDRSGVLLATLETYLDTAGDPARTAAVLTIHRSTLYYRLSHITEITALNLRDGNDRLALHLGLKLLRLT